MSKRTWFITYFFGIPNGTVENVILARTTDSSHLNVTHWPRTCFLTLTGASYNRMWPFTPMPWHPHYNVAFTLLCPCRLHIWLFTISFDINLLFPFLLISFAFYKTNVIVPSFSLLYVRSHPPRSLKPPERRLCSDHCRHPPHCHHPLLRRFHNIQISFSYVVEQDFCSSIHHNCNNLSGSPSLYPPHSVPRRPCN